MNKVTQLHRIALARALAIKAALVTAALTAPVAFAQSGGGIDFASAATDLKTTALAALAAIGVAILAVVAAVAAFKIGKGLVKG